MPSFSDSQKSNLTVLQNENSDEVSVWDNKELPRMASNNHTKGYGERRVRKIRSETFHCPLKAGTFAQTEEKSYATFV